MKQTINQQLIIAVIFGVVVGIVFTVAVEYAYPNSQMYRVDFSRSKAMEESCDIYRRQASQIWNMASYHLANYYDDTNQLDELNRLAYSNTGYTGDEEMSELGFSPFAARLEPYPDNIQYGLDQLKAEFDDQFRQWRECRNAFGSGGENWDNN